jgi:hypothetical protein
MGCVDGTGLLRSVPEPDLKQDKMVAEIAIYLQMEHQAFIESMAG